MVLTHPFHCPTRVIEGLAFDLALVELIGGRPWVLATSCGWRGRGAVERIVARCGEPVAIVDDVDENPTISTVSKIAPHVQSGEVLVGLGGGSVIDALKGAAALAALDHNMETFLAHLRKGTELPRTLVPKPIIAVPTTSGTGSEVTPWGTIWGEDGIKHSVKHEALYPGHAVIDPALTLTMPRELTITTGLDALSHAMESVWNRRHTAVTDALAAQAIKLLRETLRAAVERPDDIAARRVIQTASVMAGLAMGTTQTALAHSISYPFTSRFGLPHGLACSFTLAEVARFNIAQEAGRLAPIASGLGCEISQIPDILNEWFDGLGLGEIVLRYVTPEVTDDLGDNVITRARAANNIRDITGPQARRLARAALDRLCTATAGPAPSRPAPVSTIGIQG